MRIVVNGTDFDIEPAHCEINLATYNYSLHRAMLAACNRLNGQRSAQLLVVGFAGATFWICGEIVVRLASRFASWRALYPWTILLSTLGTIIITISHILNHLVDEPVLGLWLEATGWIGMVTGFALVLYSRLHILITSRRILRLCLAIIIIDALLCHTPVIVASVYTGPYRAIMFRAGFSLAVLFVLQENAFALLYIYAFIRFVGGWRGRPWEREASALLKQLVLAEVVVFCTDAVPLTLLYTQAYIPREAIHPFCYAVKLSVEFWILNNLVRYSRARQVVVDEVEGAQPQEQQQRGLYDGVTVGCGCGGGGVGAQDNAHGVMMVQEKSVLEGLVCALPDLRSDVVVCSIEGRRQDAAVAVLPV